ncbi:MAG: flagellar export protein FliJ [Pseudomonadota bacterium]|nr:flagellar export protein FliJ [Pseudomonadota bacterium]
MTKDSALDTLLELAQTQTDDAAKYLGALNAQGMDMEAKLALLMQYWQEYCARFQASMQQGLTAADWRNYQDFLEKLDTAIIQQREALASARLRVEAGQIAWLSARRTLKSYDTLAQRHMRAELLHMARREQKETDEHASNVAARQDPSH